MENKPENEDAIVVQPKTSVDVKNNDEDNISSDSNDEALDDNQLMSHQEAMEQFKDALAELIVGDPYLCDLHTSVTLEEVNSYIALEHGQAMTVNVRRADNVVLPVVVTQNATVLELKKAIRRHVILRHARENLTQHISWRYIWRRFWLYFDGQKLAEDQKLLKDYGITNRSEITFIRRLCQK